MKKVLLLLVILVAILGITACKNEHTHSVTGELIVVNEATCVTEGQAHMLCTECGEIVTSFTISKSDKHTEEIIPVVESTCSEKGLTEGKKCSVCKDILVAQQETPLISHTYDDKYDKSCNKCGFIRDAECAHGETETLKGYASTCTQTGLTDGIKCKKCGEILTAQTVINIKAHTEVIDKAVDATCTSTGLTEGKRCSVCSEVFVAQQEIPVTDHTYDDKYDETCNRCGFIRDAECAHVNVTVLTKKDATCTEYGLTDGEACTKCEEVLVVQKVIPALGHTEVVDAAVDPTCTETGLTEGKHCSRCNKTLVAQTTVVKLEHDYYFDNTENIQYLCNGCDFSTKGSIGLSYTINNDGSCNINGIGTCNDVEIFIPAYIDGHAVTSVGGFKDVSKLTFLGIPDTVITISSNAFENCKNLKNVLMSQNLTSIGGSAFENCSSLECIIIPNKVKSIPRDTFYRCTNMKYVYISSDSSLQSIGYQAFYHCEKLEEIYLPPTVKTIGMWAFSSCTSLKTVNIPEGITEIDDGVFIFCESLSYIIIPKTVKVIHAWAFRDCINLETIIIHNEIDTIHEEAFLRCKKIKTVFFEGNSDTWQYISVGSGIDSQTVYFYSESMPVVKGRYWHYVDGVPTVWK